MGNSNKNDQINVLGNLYSQWQIKQKGQYMNVWCKKDNAKVQLQEYQFRMNDQNQFMKEKELYQLRKNHPQLVSTYYFSWQQQKDFCASNYRGILFIQRIPLRLVNITDIPFPDILHVYLQGFKGLQLLSQKFGYFEVKQDKFCINNLGITKVWLNSQLQKCYASKNVNQQQMVKSFLKAIQVNTDLDTMPKQQPSIMKFIYSNKNQLDVNFAYAKEKFKQYVQKYNHGQVPQKLYCFQKVGGPTEIAKQIQISRKNQQTNIKIGHQNFATQNDTFTLKTNNNIIRRSRVIQPSLNNAMNNSQMIRMRSVSPPVFRESQKIGHNIYKVTQNSVGYEIFMNNSQINNENSNQFNRLKSRPHQSTQKAFYQQSISNVNYNLNQSQSPTRLVSNQTNLNRGIQNTQIKFINQLQPRQVLVMEPIKSESKKIIRNADIIQNKIVQFKKLNQLPITQTSPQKSIAVKLNNQITSHQFGSQQNANSSDIFDARPVEASNVFKSLSSPFKQQSQAYSSSIGKQKPIYQSNFISQDQLTSGVQKYTQFISKGSLQSNVQVEWRDYTQQYTQRNQIENKKGFSKQGKNIYEGQALNNKAKNSSAQLFDELNKMKHRVNQQVSKSRHQAQKDAFNLIKSHPNQIRQIHNFNEDPNQFAYDNSLYTSFNSLNKKLQSQSENISSLKKKQNLNENLNRCNFNFSVN